MHAKVFEECQVFDVSSTGTTLQMKYLCFLFIPFTSSNNSVKNKAKRKLNNEIDLILKIESLMKNDWQFKGK